jgi:anti-sigma regulatory factor (Ser/Thr protein kinase)
LENVVKAFSVSESSQVGEVRRFAQRAAATLGYGDGHAGRAAIVATELATNVVRHGHGGEMIVDADTGVLNILALDKGPGIADVDVCMRDGFSTAGSRGEGLGAVARQSDLFDVYSRLGRGTAIFARITARKDAKADGLSVGVVCVPYTGEEVCGDAWGVVQDGPGAGVIVADGLGHGPDAARAANATVEAYRREATRPPAEALARLHDAIGGTRGAAAAIARLEPTRGAMRYAGMGNIAAAVVSGTAVRRAVSLSGILGHTARRTHEFEYPLTENFNLVMHSDGLRSNWNLADYPGLMTRHPMLVAGILYRDFNRGRDDVTVLVARQG